MNKKIITIGAILMVMAIILGAFGAHTLKEVIDESRLASFEVGVKYQVYHSLALMVLGLNADKFQFRLNGVTTLLFIGVILFSGSLYILSIQEIIGEHFHFLGPVTPLGGLLMIVGWIFFIFKLIRNN